MQMLRELQITFEEAFLAQIMVIVFSVRVSCSSIRIKLLILLLVFLGVAAMLDCCCVSARVAAAAPFDCEYRYGRHVIAASHVENRKRQPCLELEQKREILFNGFLQRIIRHEHDNIAEKQHEKLQFQIQFIVYINPLHVHYECVCVRLRIIHRQSPQDRPFRSTLLAAVSFVKLRSKLQIIITLNQF